jgi:hypothetical protein
MGKAEVIGLGVTVWILLAILVAFVVARTLRLRDRQCPDRVEPGTPPEGELRDDAESFQKSRRWRLRSKM